MAASKRYASLLLDSPNGAQPLRELVSIHLRRPDVEQRHLRPVAFEAIERFAAAVGHFSLTINTRR